MGLDRQTDRHLYLVIKLRVVPSGAKSNPLSTGVLSTKIHYLHGKRCVHFYVVWAEKKLQYSCFLSRTTLDINPLLFLTMCICACSLIMRMCRDNKKACMHFRAQMAICYWRQKWSKIHRRAILTLGSPFEKPKWKEAQLGRCPQIRKREMETKRCRCSG